MAQLVNVFLQLGSSVVLQGAGGCPERLQSPEHCGSHRVWLEELVGLLEPTVASSQTLPTTGDNTGKVLCSAYIFRDNYKFVDTEAGRCWTPELIPDGDDDGGRNIALAPRRHCASSVYASEPPFATAARPRSSSPRMEAEPLAARQRHLPGQPYGSHAAGLVWSPRCVPPFPEGSHREPCRAPTAG